MHINIPAAVCAPETQRINATSILLVLCFIFVPVQPVFVICTVESMGDAAVGAKGVFVVSCAANVIMNTL